MDEREFTISIPALDAAGAESLSAALRTACGVRPASVRANLDRKEITLVYDSMLTAKKNLEFLVAERGYTANGVTPESVGKR